MLSKVCVVFRNIGQQSLTRMTRTAALSYKPSQPSNAAVRERVRVSSGDDGEGGRGAPKVACINTVREIPGLVQPKFSTHSYATSRAYDMHLMCDTVYERVNVMARARPNDVAYKFMLGQASLTFGELKHRVDELAQSFLQLGFKKVGFIIIITNKF